MPLSLPCSDAPLRAEVRRPSPLEHVRIGHASLAAVLCCSRDFVVCPMTQPVESSSVSHAAGLRASLGALVLLAACGGGMDADSEVENSAQSPMARLAPAVDQTPLSTNLLLNPSFDERVALGALPTMP